MRYVLAVLALGAAVTFAASAAMAEDSVYGYPLTDESPAVTLAPATDSTTVAGPADHGVAPVLGIERGDNVEGGR